MKVEGGSEFTRKEIDNLTEIAKSKNAKGLAYISIKKDEISSPIIKLSSENLVSEVGSSYIEL